MGGLAFLFPGQGAFDGALFSGLRSRFPQAEDAFRDIDRVALSELGVRPSEVLAQLGPSVSLDRVLTDAPEALQFAILGLSFSAFRVLESRGLAPDVLLGHSFGEIAALTCGGYFELEDAAWIVSQRVRALRDVGPDAGAMLALSCSEARVQHLVSLTGEEVAIAVVNGPQQVVLSGTRSGISRAERAAWALQIGVARIRSPHAFHFPSGMRAAEKSFRAALRQLRARSPRHRVYSPIHGGYYPTQSFDPEVLAEHLLLPVRFDRAVLQLLAEGISGYVECGARDALVRSVETLAAGRPLRCAVTALPAGADVGLSIERVLERTQTRPPPAGPPASAQGTIPQGTRSREEVSRELAALLGRTLDYPVSVFTEEVGLESDLAIDSVKQTELATSVQKLYGLDAAWSTERRLMAATFGQLVDRVLQGLRAEAPERPLQPGVAAAPTLASPQPAEAVSHALDRGAVRAALVSLFAQALEYPGSVFTDDVELEAELAIDSVKRTELLGQVERQFGLSGDAALRPLDGTTFGSLVETVCRKLGARPAKAPVPVPAPQAPAERAAGSSVRDLVGRFALVTGGLDGLGRAITTGLLSRGAEVVVNGDAPTATLLELEEEARVQGVKLHVVRADAGHPDRAERIRSLFAEVERKVPRLDVLVNNTADGAGPRVDEPRDSHLDRALGEVQGALSFSQRAVPLMRASRPGGASGCIVHVLPGRGTAAGAYGLAASVLRGNFEALTGYLAAEYGSLNIRTNAASAAGSDSAALSDVVMFLTSEASRGLNGQVLVVEPRADHLVDDASRAAVSDAHPGAAWLGAGGR